jgi:hypothetical protein
MTSMILLQFNNNLAGNNLAQCNTLLMINIKYEILYLAILQHVHKVFSTTLTKISP